MRFTLLVTGPAYGTQNASSAYQFAKSLLNNNYNLTNIFFYQEGVYNANLLISPDNNEIDLVRAWHKLHLQYDVILHICTTSGLRRGIVGTIAAERFALSSITNLQDGFLASSLYTLAESILTCDRFIQF